MSEALRVLIAGCGDVGGKLATMLAEDGHRVWGVRRNIDRLPANVIPLQADMAANNYVEALPPDLDLVFYTASASGDRTESGYRRVYVDGLAHLLARLRSQEIKPHRVFFTSSTGVYGQTDGSWIDERSPTEPQRFTGEIMLDAERTLLDSALPGTVVRLAGIYGPGRKRLLGLVAKGAPVTYPMRFTNRIHRDDCAGFLRHLALMPNPESIYIGVDHNPAPYHEVISWLAGAMKVPTPVPVAEDGTDFGKRCSNRKLQGTGYTLYYPSYREGYAELLGSTT